MEPIYAPDTHNPDQGWIVTVVYDGNSHTSEVWVFDEQPERGTYLQIRITQLFPWVSTAPGRQRKVVIVQLVSGQLERNFVLSGVEINTSPRVKFMAYFLVQGVSPYWHCRLVCWVILLGTSFYLSR